MTDTWDRVVGNKVGEVTSISGTIFTPFDLQPEQIKVYDVAWALSRQGRFLGHTMGLLTVAEHSVRVLAIVEEMCPDDPLIGLTALFHDGPEAYMGDIVSPIKHIPEMAPYREAEMRAEQAFGVALGIICPLPDAVIEADKIQCGIEIRGDRWNPLKRMEPDHAFRLFMTEFERLSAILLRHTDWSPMRSALEGLGTPRPNPARPPG